MISVTCSSCSRACDPAEGGFCPACGAELPITLPTITRPAAAWDAPGPWCEMCGTENLPGAHRCQVCGGRCSREAAHAT